MVWMMAVMPFHNCFQASALAFRAVSRSFTSTAKTWRTFESDIGCAQAMQRTTAANLTRDCFSRLFCIRCQELCRLGVLLRSRVFFVVSFSNMCASAKALCASLRSQRKSSTSSEISFILRSQPQSYRNKNNANTHVSSLMKLMALT